MNILGSTDFMTACYNRTAAVSRLPENQLWRTALYTRLSHEDGDKEESDSISNQKDLLCAFMESKPDMELYSIYEDDGYTGINFEPPDFQRMITDIQAGLVNCVIVKDLSRLGRNHLFHLFTSYNSYFLPYMSTQFIYRIKTNHVANSVTTSKREVDKYTFFC